MAVIMIGHLMAVVTEETLSGQKLGDDPLKLCTGWGTWVAQLVGLLTLGFG